ncbi:MAG: hypothetical protein GX452_13935 [Ignavibacteriales bacterium]|nr:hypothetical protein [Ignavibacteriales bacterium]
MIDDVITALKNASGPWGKNVYRGQPPNFTILPVVGVYMLNESDFVAGDGKGMQAFKGFVNIDIWTKDRIEDIKTSVRAAMYGLSGYVRQNAFRELVEDNGLKHLQFEFEIILGGFK